MVQLKLYGYFKRQLEYILASAGYKTYWALFCFYQVEYNLISFSTSKCNELNP
jgi:hypothetical protein